MQIATGHDQFDGVTDVAAVTEALIADILNDLGRSPPLPERGCSAAQIEQLLRSGARIDAALLLIALKLPRWQLRRIAYDGGEWHCALSHTRELADWLDQSADGRHADLALAILHAVVDALRMAAPESGSSATTVRSQETDVFVPICCDNFS